MRGLSLITAGVLILVVALAIAFIIPDRQIQSDPAAKQTVLQTQSEAGSLVQPTNTTPMPSEPSRSQLPAGEPSAATQPSAVTQPSVASDQTETPVKPTVAAPDGPLEFPAWPKPRVALLVTGEQEGYFEPCGCTANQLGGMNRRASLFDQLTSLGWPVRGIDVGTLSRRSARQSQIKFETTLQALRQMNYVAVGMGPEELRLDPGYLISQHVTDGELPLAFVSSNLTFYGSPDIGTPLPFRIVDVDGFKIGITSVMSESRRKEVIPDRTAEEAAAADIQWLDPTESLTRVEQQFASEEVQFRVLLSQSSVEESKALAEKFPQFNLIVTTEGYGDGERKTELIGSTQLLQVGEKGKYAGVVGIYPDDAANPIRFELVTLSGAHFGESESMIQLMQAYQDRLKDEQIVATEPAVAHPSGAQYVGAETCGECHTKAYEIWQNTAHAHAFESLDPSHKHTGFERLNGVLRTHDPECLACHVTGWDPKEYLRFRSGFINEDMAISDDEKVLQSLLANNQCENCHGPGSLHIEQIEAGNIEAAKPLVKVALQESTCVKCHDGENSPDFNFEKYWEEVKHYGLD